MKNKKLIFFDIDGTLITEGKDHYVPESTTEALDKLQKNGHICIINTGRPYAALDDIIMSISVSGYVCGCGTYIQLGDKILMAEHLDGNLCSEIVTKLEECRLEWVLEGEKALYYADRKYTTRLWKDIDSIKSKLPENIHPIKEDQYKKVNFDKFCICITEQSDLNTFQSIFEDRLTFIDRGNGFYEIVPKGYSKASGMKYLEEALGIDHSNTIAVGDSSNDIPMLEYAQTGILMGNAPTSLHAYADYITSDITNDGILNAFENLKLI